MRGQDDFRQGNFLMLQREYHAAAEFFARSYREGNKCQDSLYFYGKAKFLEATFQLNGFDDFTRRSTLITASQALNDVLKKYGDDYYSIAELCCIEYALGLLLKSRNGRTSQFNTYYNQLRRGDPAQISAVDDFLPILDREFP